MRNQILSILPALILVGAVSVGLGSCTKKTEPGFQGVQFSAEQRALVKSEDLKVGTGDAAVPGKTVTVHYTGWLTSGKKFDSSYDHGQPFSFVLGTGSVIPGWDMGVEGMRVGGKRKLTLPPQIAYGHEAKGDVIPADSTLVFEVELLGVNG
jgi:FKBP-type peptidyl-prolyl cis-trans isomerase FkpA